MIQLACVSTVSSRWFRTSKEKSTRPSSGRLFEARTSFTVMRVRNASPGRTGRSHFTSSTPGAPIELASSRSRSATRRMLMAQVCQPEAIRLPTKLSLAASSSVWNGCGSYSRAKATMASLVTTVGP